MDNKNYDSSNLFKEVYPTFLKLSNKYIPVYKYLRKANINCIDDLNKSGFSYLQKQAPFSRKVDFTHQPLKSHFDSTWSNKTMQEIIAGNPAERASMLIPFCVNIDLDELQGFLALNKDNLKSCNSNYASYFRKLACMYDHHKFGFQ